MQRIDQSDLIYKSEVGKFTAVLKISLHVIKKVNLY
jgi:hypothetical protein